MSNLLLHLVEGTEEYHTGPQSEQQFSRKRFLTCPPPPPVRKWSVTHLPSTFGSNSNKASFSSHKRHSPTKWRQYDGTHLLDYSDSLFVRWTGVSVNSGQVGPMPSISYDTAFEVALSTGFILHYIPVCACIAAETLRGHLNNEFVGVWKCVVFSSLCNQG
jgi:hypothetical protein